MRLVGERLEFTCDEQALLALACAGEAHPDAGVEAFAQWLVAPLAEHRPALRHGARVALARRYCEAFVQADCAGPDRGIVWAVTRHPGALAWLYLQGVRPQRVVAHLAPSQPAAGDTVVGILPVSLAADLHARGVRCVHLAMDAAPGDRGRELSPARMRECGARLEMLEIVRSSVQFEGWNGSGAAPCA